MPDSMVPEILELAHKLNQLSLKSYALSPITETKTVGTYERQVWRIMRELFTSEIDEYQFVDDFRDFINNQFTRAWNAGAREMGVNPDQFTMSDIAQLANRIGAEQDHMLQLADDIMIARAQRLDLATFRARFQMRAEMYANRYIDIQNEARVWFGATRDGGLIHMEWELGPTEKHCISKGGKIGCSDLSGVVATAYDWHMSGIRPQSNTTTCGGYKCQCRLSPTDKPLTPGGIPR